MTEVLPIRYARAAEAAANGNGKMVEMLLATSLIQSTLDAPSPRKTRSRPTWLIAAAGVWAMGIIGGLGALTWYASVPGPASAIAMPWPQGTLPTLAKDRYTLVMTVHPQCPCSRASISELEVLLTHCQGRLNAFVVFSNPPGVSDPIDTSGLWEMVARLPGVQPVLDQDARIARQLGAETSGHTYLYDPSGTVRFQGGITGARGHVGNNDGRAAIKSIVDNVTTPIDLTPTFGCKLQ